VNTTRQRPDDQYVMPVEASRRGAHRARMSPMLSALPFVAVAVVVTGVVALAWTLFGGPGNDPTATPAGVVSRSVTPSGSATAGRSKSPSSSRTTKVASRTASTPAASNPGAGVVDRTSPIVVRNSTRTQGLARRAAAALQSKGWTIDGTPDNYRPAINSTVFYAQDAQLVTAQAVAKDLGIALVQQSTARATKGITVILGADYQP
jgi:LytR cell envelope-related transcriptional attenuator